jgi:nitric oxide reductase large subunit
VAFWSLNVGLVLMLGLTLLPIGLMQPLEAPAGAVRRPA